MNTIPRFRQILFQKIVFALLLLPTMLIAQQSPPGIPEPGLIIYGRVLDRVSGKSVQANTAAFQVTGNNDTVNVAVTLVSINGQSFYVAQVPFETRAVGVQTFQKTLNTVALTTGNTPYGRTVTVNGKAATFKAPGTGQLLFGAAERGRIENLDLEVEGIPVDPGPGSRPILNANLKPVLRGGMFAGITFEWDSEIGKSYTVFRTSDLSKLFEKIGTIPATPPTNSFTDLGAVGPGPFFYSLSVDL
ncbi:MAG: hypothetical protein O2960_28015 [Verrucomicrobia bacterium]|nr:hypothetical protein [Verrucomicrobiota bacterium]